MENFKERKVISVKEFNKKKPITIEVAENSSVTIGPNEKLFSEALHYISVKTVEDLQELSIIPQGLSKESLLKAISNDDDESLTIAKKNFDFSTKSNCKCHNHAENSLQNQYKSVRKKGNFQLAKLLSNHLGKQILWDDYEAVHAYKMITDIAINQRYYGRVFSQFLFNDIIINSNATLKVSAGTDLMKGRNLIIHRNGKMEIKSSYLFLKCETARANSLIIDSLALGDKLITTY